PKTFLDLQIREPAIVLKTPDNTWLPKYDFTTELSLKLGVITNPTTREIGPALPHMAALANIAMNNISQHNGICTNYDDPAQPEREKYDIFFDLIANLPHFGGLNADPMDPNRASLLRGKTLLKGDKPSMIKVKTMDYGASAQISLENYPPEYQAFPNNRLLIPADDNQNGIPDASKKHDDAVSADYDNDDKGLNIWTWGDGLTNWEEYRGFRVCTDAQCQGFTHRRTDPEKRDFFLYSEFDLTYAAFEKAADLNVEFINPTLMDEKRVLNYLSDFHKGGDQYAVHVKRGEPVTNWSITSMLAKAPLHLAGIDVQTAAYYMDIFLKGEMEEMPWWFGFYWSFIREGEGVLGKAQHADGFTDKGYFTPNQVKYLVINPFKIARLGYNLEEVVYHELGHTCNLPHHGGNEVRKICLLNKGKPQTYDYITGGTVYSGEMSCMMRYEYPGAIGTIPGHGFSRTECIDCDINKQQTRANLVQIRDEVAGWKKPDKTVVKRDKFCTTRGAGQPYGATAEGTGECYQRIRVKCW
ncbi:MAG: hypothetical protein KDE26_30350, partial [Bacteroidetes bacterium]|nr:hypothetical protein [Bacteroidota bacterium]